MPTTKRMRRHARATQHIEEGSPRWAYLLYGHDLGMIGETQPPFDSVDEQRAAWNANRDALMDACQPGERPDAYFRFELKVQPPTRWFDALQVLIEHGLIGDKEAAAAEALHEELSGTQSSTNSAFDEPGEAAKYPTAAAGIARHFDAVEAWHEWRGRAALAERYRNRAEMVRAAINTTISDAL